LAPFWALLAFSTSPSSTSRWNGGARCILKLSSRADPQAPATMIATLLVSLAAMTLVYATLLVYRTMLERTRDENRALEQAL
jgi:hypothetical protein